MEERRAVSAAYEVLTEGEKREGMTRVALLAQTQLHKWYPWTWKRNVGGVKLRFEETARKRELHRIQTLRRDTLKNAYTAPYTSLQLEQMNKEQEMIRILELEETLREKDKEAADRMSERVSGSIASV